MSITHSWNGTVLTITSDAGTSSADLKGDTGCRGPQGPHGVVYDAEGNIVMEGYATEQYVNDLVATIDPNMEGYATEEYVDQQIINVQTGGSIDMSSYATKAYVNKAIKANGNYVETLTQIDLTNDPLKLENYKYIRTSPNLTAASKEDFPFDENTLITVLVQYEDGKYDKITGYPQAGSFEAWDGKTDIAIPNERECVFSGYISGVNISMMTSADGTYMCNFGISTAYEEFYNIYCTKIAVAIGDKAPGVSTIDPYTIPVDGTTITIVDGKLTVIGGTDIASSEEVEY